MLEADSTLRDIMQPDGLSEGKIIMTAPGIKPMTYGL